MYSTFLAVALLVMATYSLPVHAQNLIENPGFETVTDTTPSAWDVYVLPREGADAVSDDVVAYEGQRSARLNIATPYPSDPANNWSQNVLVPLGGKTVEVRGAIRTADAGEAAIWLQCWQKRPWRLLHEVSSSSTSRIYGTRAWTPVQFTVDVPDRTDYVTLRCVLLDQGTAWFDAVTMLPGEASTDPEQTSPTVASPTPPEPPRPAAPADRTGAEAKEMAEDLQDQLRKTQRAVLDANRSLQASNESLADQVRLMQQELDRARAEMEVMKQELLRPPTPPNPRAQRRSPAPPLVPFSFDEESLP